MTAAGRRAAGKAARAPAGPHLPEPGRPRLSVVVPAFREGRRIAATVDRLRDALWEPLGTAVEVVVVDDGSPDDTAVAAGNADLVIRFPANRGKGAAVRAGALAATGSAIVFTDADLAYPPSQVLRVLDEVEKGWDVVAGSRQPVGAGEDRVRALSHAVFQLTTRLVLDRPITDTQCGLKGFHRDAARAIFTRARIDRFAFDVELLWLAGHLGFTVEELPVELGRSEGSTVRLGPDAARMLRDLLRVRRWGRAGAYGPGGPETNR